MNHESLENLNLLSFYLNGVYLVWWPQGARLMAKWRGEMRAGSPLSTPLSSPPFSTISESPYGNEFFTSGPQLTRVLSISSGPPLTNVISPVAHWSPVCYHHFFMLLISTPPLSIILNEHFYLFFSVRKHDHVHSEGMSISIFSKNSV